MKRPAVDSAGRSVMLEIEAFNFSPLVPVISDLVAEKKLRLHVRACMFCCPEICHYCPKGAALRAKRTP